ncbi:15313_t:CDS:2, partial [Cetraspora pellucida]
MSSIKHNKFKLNLVESNTEIEAQSLTSITSSNLLSEHLNAQTHHEVLCLICPSNEKKTWLRKISDSNTTNLWHHLKSYHPNNDPRKNDKPLNKHFQQIIKLLNPNTHVPTDNTVKNDIMSNFENEHMNMKCLLQNVPEKLSFTIDTWTLVNVDLFFGITVHWISENWELKNTLLDFINLSGPHSGENLCGAFVESCYEFGILTKVFAIMSNNATNNNTFMKHLEH